ncbi:hypothetical protein D3C78_1585920 [compost metagenome]
MGLPFVQGCTQGRELALQHRIVIPQAHATGGDRSEIGVELRFAERRKNLMDTSTDRLLAALPVSAQGITQATVGKAAQRAHTRPYAGHADQLGGKLAIGASAGQQPFTKTVGCQLRGSQLRFLLTGQASWQCPE